MNEPNERLKENNNALVISEATMSKNIVELEEEERQLVETIKKLTNNLNKTREENTVDFELFKSINGQLRGNKDLLEEVRIALQIKKGEGIHDFVEVSNK